MIGPSSAGRDGSAGESGRVQPLPRQRLDPSGRSPSTATVALAGRGFILLRTGFFGGGITSAVPPLASIFSSADLEKWCALTVSFLVSSPLPRTRTPSAGPLARPSALSDACVDDVAGRRRRRRGRRR